MPRTRAPSRVAPCDRISALQHDAGDDTACDTLRDAHGLYATHTRDEYVDANTAFEYSLGLDVDSLG